MKKKYLFLIIGIITFVAGILFVYDIYYQHYREHLWSIHGAMRPVNNVHISADNYKDLDYHRVILPGAGGPVRFETIHFQNDSLVVIETLAESGDYFLPLRRLFGVESGHYQSREFILRNDTLFAKVSDQVAAEKPVLFFPFTYENDSLKVGLYDYKGLYKK